MLKSKRHKTNQKTNPHCPVPGCRTKKAHMDDPIMPGIARAFASPTDMTQWTCAAIAELAQSIASDLENGRTLAFLSRVRQPEELYFRTLYALFVATDKELPHILSGELPNGFSQIYEKVNKVVLAGRGRLMVEQPGLTFGTFKAMDTLNDGAHVSFRAFLTVIGWAKNPEHLPSPDHYRKHLQKYCAYLTYMHGMFKAGKQKADVLLGVQKLHTPAP
jgi:hypothetical protein